ncbi:MAG: hypothetical protein GY757_54315 [bacterium]|nr:hypothetical protein [bacterium]
MQNVRPSDTVNSYYQMSKNTNCDNLELEVFFILLADRFNYKYRENDFQPDTQFDDVFKLIEVKT